MMPSTFAGPPTKFWPEIPPAELRTNPGTQFFQMHGLDTESEADVPMEDVHHSEPVQEPTTRTTSVVAAQWPPKDDAPVAHQRRRTARRQERRTQEINSGLRTVSSRSAIGNASSRAGANVARFPSIRRTDDSASLTASSSRSVPLRPVPKGTAVRRNSADANRRSSPASGSPNRNVRARSDIPEYGAAGMERLSKSNPQAQYAAATLYSSMATGILHSTSVNSIKGDLTRYASPPGNSFLQEFFRKRLARGGPDFPTEAMETYSYEEVLFNALQEFNFERWERVNHTHLDFTKFSVAILWLISETGEYFVWTVELFRRFPTKPEQR